MIDWPAMPDGAEVLYEHAESFTRIYIAPSSTGWMIGIVNKIGGRAGYEHPPLSAETVIKIAKGMIERVKQ